MRCTDPVCGVDIFQERMSELMQGLDFCRTYLDDLLILTKGVWEDHLEQLEKVLSRLQDAGLKVNATKSYFGKPEVEYLGYMITREGIKPVLDKVRAMQDIAPPKTRKQLRSFIGFINYYRDMWKHRSGTISPLSRMTSKTTPFKWGEEQQKAFEDIKAIIARDVMLSYPDFSKVFHVYADASQTQLGATIVQDEKPIAFWSRKLTPAQTRYTVTEKELLSLVEVLKEFRNILLGQRLILHTDHQNLTYSKFNTDRVMRWRLILEEFGPKLTWLAGVKNVAADALSRLPMLSKDDKHGHIQIEECLASNVNQPKQSDAPITLQMLL